MNSSQLYQVLVSCPLLLLPFIATPTHFSELLPFLLYGFSIYAAYRNGSLDSDVEYRRKQVGLDSKPGVLELK